MRARGRRRHAVGSWHLGASFLVVDFYDFANDGCDVRLLVGCVKVLGAADILLRSDGRIRCIRDFGGFVENGPRAGWDGLNEAMFGDIRRWIDTLSGALLGTLDWRAVPGDEIQPFCSVNE